MLGRSRRSISTQSLPEDEGGRTHLQEEVLELPRGLLLPQALLESCGLQHSLQSGTFPPSLRCKQG